MSDDQKKLLAELLGEYLKNMPSDVSSRRRAALMQAGIDSIYFAWWGDTEAQPAALLPRAGPDVFLSNTTTRRTSPTTCIRTGATWRATSDQAEEVIRRFGKRLNRKRFR